MSASGEFDKVTSLGRHNAQSVIDALDIPPDDTIARQAVRFVFKQMYDEFRPSSRSALLANETTADETFKKIKARYDLVRLYENFFFPGDHRYDRDAFILALICDGFVTNINKPIQDPSNPAENIRRDDGFGNDVVLSANIIFEEAAALSAYGVPEDGVFSMEAAFLAHINIFEDVLEIENSFNDYGRDKLMAVLDKDIPVWRNFIFTWTGIGPDLMGYIQNVENAIQTKLTPPSGPRRPHLSIVPEPPQ